MILLVMCSKRHDLILKSYEMDMDMIVVSCRVRRRLGAELLRRLSA
jgi:hypothetical protein